MWLSLSTGASERPKERGSGAAPGPIELTWILGYVTQPMGYRADSMDNGGYSDSDEVNALARFF
jgi:hypothetical protein